MLCIICTTLHAQTCGHRSPAGWGNSRRLDRSTSGDPGTILPPDRKKEGGVRQTSLGVRLPANGEVNSLMVVRRISTNAWGCRDNQLSPRRSSMLRSSPSIPSVVGNRTRVFPQATADAKNRLIDLARPQGEFIGPEAEGVDRRPNVAGTGKDDHAGLRGQLFHRLEDGEAIDNGYIQVGNHQIVLPCSTSSIASRPLATAVTAKLSARIPG